MPDTLADGSRAALERLAAAAPALSITSECDPLRDEGEALATRMQDDGIGTTVMRPEGTLHGALSIMAAVPAADFNAACSGTA